MPTLVENVTRLEDRFVSAFEMNEGRHLNGTNARLQGLRREAIERFAALGFPDRKAETWKYTNITRVLQREYTLRLAPVQVDITQDDLDAVLVPGLDAHVVVLVNGRFSEELSQLHDLPPGVVVTGFARASDEHAEVFNRHFAHYADYRNEVFAALNTAFAQEGIFVHVPRRTVVEKPIHIVSLTKADEDVMLQPRNLFVVEEGGQVKLIQTSKALSTAKIFVNEVTEVFVDRDAHVDLYEVQDENENTSQVSTLQGYQAGESVFRASTFTFDGEVIRNNVNVLPDAERCESHLYGLFVGSGATHIDNHTLVDHAKPNCFSNELYKGVLNDQATGVFNGRVLVRRDAQQTNAYQSNKSIVLSDKAHMYSKPELEIYADDVKCSHGATTGQLDPEALFYLRSRGLSEQKARAMLLVAFARDVLDNIRIAPLREMLDQRIVERFHR